MVPKKRGKMRVLIKQREKYIHKLNLRKKRGRGRRIGVVG
jgi:hypothetical protein